MLTTSLSLHEGFLKNLEWQTVALDIHLCSGQTVTCTCCLEVHIAEVVLITEDIAQDRIAFLTRVVDKTHGNTGHRLLHRHTGIHQCQRTGTGGSHRGRTVGLEHLAHQTHGVREVLRDLTLQCTPCQVAVANLATAYAALCLSLAGAERWEVIVEQETLIAAVEHTVDKLLVELGTECTGSERHRLTTLEDS